ncbi:MAG: hypothetical protein LRZ84_04380 [Desertifilum sp.]|nr:hypothetical protein [Desertifilum sp.]
MDLKTANCPFLHVIKTPQHLESLHGTDWEWWIGSNQLGWLRYAIQAKKINCSSLRYDDLEHKVKGQQQLEILRSYSMTNNALGRYCFYNYTEKIDSKQHWHCKFPFASKQLGCSLATLSTVSKSLKNRGCRNFDFIHSERSTIPLRCLVKCPIILSIYHGDYRFLSKFEDYENVRIFESLPRNIQAGVESGSFEEWDSDFYSSEIWYRPQNILVAELPDLSH